jgi:autotransporter-associated beta strand protein
VDLVGTSNEINIPEGKNASWTTENRQTYSNKITGAGRITVYCATEKGNGWVATRTPLQLNTSEFTGTLVPQATNASDGRFTLNTSSGIAKGIMDIPSGITVQNTGKVYTIGELAGSGSLGEGCAFSNGATVGANTWKVGSLNTDFTFDGTIVGSGTIFEKVGTGMMTLSNTNNFTGKATISDGTICLNKSSAKSGMLGTGELVVSNGATLCGVGLLTNSSVTISKGALLRPGVKENSTSGTLKMNKKNLTVNSGATVRFYIGSRSLYTKLTDVDVMYLRGTLKVNLRGGIELEEGDEFQLWTSSSTRLATSVELKLDSLANGLAWDTSNLDSGILRVVKATDIQGVELEREVECVVYTVDGIECAHYTCRYAEAVQRMYAQGLPKGIYLLRVRKDSSDLVEKHILM